MDSVDKVFSDSYPSTRKKLCYIINNEEFLPSLNLSVRSGTAKDFEKLKTLFKRLNFTVENHKNCTANQMVTNLRTCYFCFIYKFYLIKRYIMNMK